MNEPRVYECEKCHERYPEEFARSYGRDVEIPGGAMWCCHACINPPSRKDTK